MFGKEQSEIVDDEDVGAFIEELRRQGAGEVQEFIEDEYVGEELSSVDELSDMDAQRKRMHIAGFVELYGTKTGRISSTVPNNAAKPNKARVPHNEPIQSMGRDLLVESLEAEEAGDGMAQSSTDASGRRQNTD